MKRLKQITILDFSMYLPGPYCTMVLADLGCRVIRVEMPRWPDILRRIGPKIDGHGYSYWMANRNKESLSLDFRKPSGRKAVLRLIAEADVLVEGFRPGLMTRLGLGPKALLRRFPGLVYCSLTGYGRSGPLSGRAGHDLNFQAESGMLGAGDSNGKVTFPSVQAADLSASLTAASAVLAAVLERRAGGKGRHIDISMTEALFPWLLLSVGHSFATGKPFKPRRQWWTGATALYRLYRTKDGRHLAVAALERPFAEALLRELKRPDLLPALDDPSPAGQKKLAGTLARIFRRRTLAAWEKLFGGKDVCVSPVRTVPEAVSRAEKSSLIIRTPRKSRKGLRLIRSPIRLSRGDFRLRRTPPELGEDNVPVLRSFGFKKSEIADLHRRGLLGRREPPGL